MFLFFHVSVGRLGLFNDLHPVKNYDFYFAKKINRINSFIIFEFYFG